MPDSRFYRRAGPFRLTEIAARVSATLASPGPADLTISDIAPLAQAGAGDIVYVADVAYAQALSAGHCGACIVKAAWVDFAPKGAAVLVAADPRVAFAAVAAMFYPDVHAAPPAASPPQIATDAYVASTAVIGAGAVVGARSRVEDGAVIGPGVVIGTDCRISAHVSVSHALIGNGAIVYPGVRIGQDGFGYVPSPKGPLKVPQVGRVVIGDRVEIGANSTVDRGALEDTVIGNDTKIDNLVQIAHNVEIGRNCLIAAQVGISGSCRIGDGVIIGGQAGLADHVTVGKGAQIAAKTGIMRPVAPGEAVMGYPAKPIKQFWREIASVSRLTRRDK
jgi:UDP-3-O-[3-hydroxymyristoyl] glucosamine N-acyltransferase